MIKIENLRKTYGAVHALDGLSLDVEPNVVYGFLGPNGAGKSTTMRIISGLARADSGSVSVNGQVVGQPGVDVRTQIGVLPEDPAFYTWMTAREFLRDFVAPLYGMSYQAASQRAKELLDLVDLKKAANRRISGFSRGMRQRLGLAAALVHNPQVLLLDEPVSALDPAGRKEVLELIESLRGSTTILLSTHILADVERSCDMVGIIAKGKLITQERRADLMARYATPIFEVESGNGIADWTASLRSLSFIEHIAVDGSLARIQVSDVPAAQQALLASLAERQLPVLRFELVRPSLEDIFLRLTQVEA